jgi:hypothetical protein
VYAGYVEDLATGHKEPLVWLQNLFSHQGHTNIEAAIKRAGFSRMDKLSPAGNMKVVMFAKGFKDLVVENVVVLADGANAPAIEQGKVFYVEPDGKAIKDEAGKEVEKNQLHVGNLSTAALADFTSKKGVIKKGGAPISTEVYTLELEGEAEIAITLKEAFFSGSFQGAYTLNINSDTTIHPEVPFAVNRIVDSLPQLKQGEVTSTDGAITVTTGGGNITIEDEKFEFAKAIVIGGRGSSVTEQGQTTTISDVIMLGDDGVYIDASALTAAKTYTLRLVVSNLVDKDLNNISPMTYTITVE